MKIQTFISFIVGGIAGSLVTWQFLKQKYERIAQEEIDSVKEVYSRRRNREMSDNDTIEEKFVEAKPIEKPDIKEYAKMLNEMKYLHTDYSNVEKEEYAETESNDIAVIPYIISPESMGEDGYDTSSLTYYADDILADEINDKISDVEGIVGTSWIDELNQSELDSICVRNEQLKTDYEICRDYRTYNEVLNEFYPYKKEE